MVSAKASKLGLQAIRATSLRHLLGNPRASRARARSHSNFDVLVARQHGAPYTCRWKKRVITATLAADQPAIRQPGPVPCLKKRWWNPRAYRLAAAGGITSMRTVGVSITRTASASGRQPRPHQRIARYTAKWSFNRPTD